MLSIDSSAARKFRGNPAPWRSLTTALVALAGGIPAAALGQTRYSLTPSVAVGGMYDTNVFETATRPRADWLVRVSPALAGSIRSPKLNITGFVSVDMERYARYKQLDSLQARKTAGLNADYRPTRRLSLDMIGNYDQSNTPGQLTTAAGLLLGRESAEVYVLQPSMTYRITRLTTGTAAFAVMHEALRTGFNGSERSARLGGARRITERSTVLLSLHDSRYTFTGTTRVFNSRAVLAGWKYELEQHITLKIQAGPRDTDGKYSADVRVALHGKTPHTAWALDLRRTVGMLLGAVGTVDETTATADFVYWPTRSLSFEVLPAYLSERTIGTTLSARELQLRTSYRINRTISLVAWDQFDEQDGVLGGSRGERISQNMVFAGFVLNFGSARETRLQAVTTPPDWLLPEPPPIRQ